jgi:hypothetical protein
VKRQIGAVAVFGALIAVLVSACSFPGGSTATPTATSLAGGSTAQLAHAPTGTLDGAWDPAVNQATLKLSLVTLAPNSLHPVAIYNGHCGTPGTQVRALTQLAADAKGAGSISDQFTATVNAVPTSGWYVAVNNATGTDVYSKIIIACVDIPVSLTSGTSKQTVSLQVTTGVGYSQYSTGSAQLQLNGTTLTVKMTAINLEPGSTHPTYIRAGSCAAPGDPLFVPLAPLVADANGNANVTSTVQNVTQVPTGGWLLMSHRGVNLDTQIDYDPILCGSITIGTPTATPNTTPNATPNVTPT